MNRHQVQALLGLAVCAAGSAHAQLPDSRKSDQPQGATIVVGVGGEYTDNAFKSTGSWSGCKDPDKHPNAPKRDCIPIEDETKEYVDLDLGYRREGETFYADALYKGEFANYEEDTTQDDSVIQGRSNAGWRTLGGRLVLDASHERSEQLQDSRNPDIRNNKQLRDIISAGPTLSARMSPVDDLVFSGRWYDVSYDEADREDIPTATNPDNERLEGGLAWQHRLRKTDVLSGNYQYMRTEFDETSEEFEYHRLFATYQVELRNSGYSVSLGANRSEREVGESSDGFLAQASWHLESGGHRFRAVAIKQLTDSGIGLGGNSLVGEDFNPQDSNFDVVDVVERTSVDLGYGFDRLCERCTLDFGLNYDEQDFDVQPRDQELTGVRASFGYRITSTLRASLRASATSIEYPQDVTGDRTDDRTLWGLVLDWQISRSLTGRLWISDDSLESDAPGLDYDEVFGGASVRYRFR